MKPAKLFFFLFLLCFLFNHHDSNCARFSRTIYFSHRIPGTEVPLLDANGNPLFNSTFTHPMQMQAAINSDFGIEYVQANNSFEVFDYEIPGRETSNPKKESFFPDLPSCQYSYQKQNNGFKAPPTGNAILSAAILLYHGVKLVKSIFKKENREKIAKFFKKKKCTCPSCEKKNFPDLYKMNQLPLSKLEKLYDAMQYDQFAQQSKCSLSQLLNRWNMKSPDQMGERAQDRLFERLEQERKRRISKVNYHRPCRWL